MPESSRARICPVQQPNGRNVFLQDRIRIFLCQTGVGWIWAPESFQLEWGHLKPNLNSASLGLLWVRSRSPYLAHFHPLGATWGYPSLIEFTLGMLSLGPRFWSLSEMWGWRTWIGWISGNFLENQSFLAHQRSIPLGPPASSYIYSIYAFHFYHKRIGQIQIRHSTESHRHFKWSCKIWHQSKIEALKPGTFLNKLVLIFFSKTDGLEGEISNLYGTVVYKSFCRRETLVSAPYTYYFY